MDKNYMKIFDELKEMDVIDDVWQYVLNLLEEKYGVSDDFLGLMCIFFSLIDDGNICISLDAQQLEHKWNSKLSGIDNMNSKTDFSNVIKKGIAAVSQYSADSPLIFKYGTADTKTENNMFVLYQGWLFTKKFFDAKQTIEEMTTMFFPPIKSTPTQNDTEEQTVTEIEAKYNQTERGFILAHAQALAIARAKNGQNLVITGGPGTGKTTVICYLLLELLSQNKNRPVYMAALSGKAAKRMQESIASALENLNPDIKKTHQQECDILSSVTPVTIHRLLGMSGQNTDNAKKLSSNSIFVIDEASMIDVVLFANLLKTIKPDDGNDMPRIFILGDQDQLPSVQPGAVFCDLTQKQKKDGNIIELTESKRFRAGSEIYELKEHIRNGEQISVQWSNGIPSDWATELQNNRTKQREYPIRYISPADKNEIQPAIQDWYDCFYDDDEYKKVYTELNWDAPDINKVLDTIWSRTEEAKILCAEKHGPYGTDKINKIICDYIKSKNNTDSVNDDDFFVGQQVIITKNQHYYGLSNGDIGIIVSINNKKYVMIKRTQNYSDESDTNGPDLILIKGCYVFYRLHLLASDAIDSAYAITIHKSQGSEYENILVFLPESQTSPLLNRQILYTAITRTKNATYIISNEDNMNVAINNQNKRDSQLFL